MNTQTPRRANIIAGVPDLINRAIHKATQRSEPFHSLTIAQILSKTGASIDLPLLVEEMGRCIEENWTRAGRRVGGACNWRWTLEPEILATNRSPEKLFEKALAAFLPKEDWANQVPTASGLSASGDSHRNIDLAHWDGANTVTIIELKAMRRRKDGGFSCDSPIHAAFEVVVNGLLLILARKHRDRIKVIEPDKWLHKGLTVKLRVLAPPAFYRPFDLRGFEHELDSAIADLSSSHQMKTSFGFCSLDMADTLRNSLEHSSPRWSKPGAD